MNFREKKQFKSQRAFKNLQIIVLEKKNYLKIYWTPSKLMKMKAKLSDTHRVVIFLLQLVIRNSNVGENIIITSTYYPKV